MMVVLYMFVRHGIPITNNSIRNRVMSGFININQQEQLTSEPLNFTSAFLRGLAESDGLYMPADIRPIDDCTALLQQAFVPRSVRVMRHLVGDDPLYQHFAEIIAKAFDFPVAVKPLKDQLYALELFHGPSLSFKDFGARFLAGCLQHSQLDQSVTVVTATSGDTGGAVAKAFYGQPNTQVVVVYPHTGVTEQQAKHFVGLGGNVTSVAVDGSFDDCQRMVKQAFADQASFNTALISANSINVARLLAQVCYYFELFAQMPSSTPLTVAIPSGNFGNATAAMLACALGLPISKVLAVTNENDTVPRFLSSGDWQPQSVVQTITNAIDIAAPNNFSRIQYLQNQHTNLTSVFDAISISQQTTRKALQELLSSDDYLVDPHTALVWAGVKQWLAESGIDDQPAAIVATAHPVKFADEVQRVTSVAVEETMNDVMGSRLLTQQPVIAAEYQLLRRTIAGL